MRFAPTQGGGDSDILIDLVESVIHTFNLPSIEYEFFNTGLEMKAIKDHVKETAEKYNVTIHEIRPKVNIVHATRKYGVPLISKTMSRAIEAWQGNNLPLSIIDEWNDAEDKQAKKKELDSRYPRATSTVNWICSCKGDGTPVHSQFSINSCPYLLDFLRINPPDFKISNKCCYYCKKKPAQQSNRRCDMKITGERKAEGGQRAGGIQGCFYHNKTHYRLRPLFYVTDKDKLWYKEHYNIKYSDAYEVYGLKRTGCCGCPINSQAIHELELIEPYEPNVAKAAWNIFGKSYEYRQEYNAYKAMRQEEARQAKKKVKEMK